MRHVIQSTFEDELQTGNQLMQAQIASIAATQEMPVEESPDHKHLNTDVQQVDLQQEQEQPMADDPVVQEQPVEQAIEQPVVQANEQPVDQNQ